MWLVMTLPNVPLLTAYNMVFLFWRRLSARTLQPATRVLDKPHLRWLAIFISIFFMFSVFGAIYDDWQPGKHIQILLWKPVDIGLFECISYMT
jgi:hypothetical protein